MIVLERLIINASLKTPQIDLNHLTGELVFTGKSIPENSANLYEVVLKWVQNYAEHPKQLTNFRLKLEYFNTSSSIWIARIIKVLSSIKRSDITIIIHLYFDITEFESMESEEIRDEIGPIIDILGTPTVNIGIKIHGIDADGETLKETIVLI